MASAAVANDFGQHVRYWRKKSGCTQLELSLIAGYSQRHISFLESGRAKPSRETVIALSDALSVPVRKRNELLLAAGYAPLYSQEPLDSQVLRPALSIMQELLEMHRPFPAILVDRVWNTYGANENARMMFSHFTHESSQYANAESLNTLRFCLDPEGLRPYMLNWEQFMHSILRQLKDDLQTEVISEAHAALVETLENVLGKKKCADLVTQPALELKLQRGDLSLSFITMMSYLNFPMDATLADLRVETFLPSDVVTREYLNSLDQALARTSV
ncbi:MAG: helix-turn-helix domain-containing protein [Pseudomonadota bacterium]